MPTPRSVRIDQDERGGWSSDRPRRDGAPPREADLAVRNRVLTPTSRLRYTPGSLVIVVSGSKEERDRLVARTVEDKNAVLSLDRVRSVLAGRVPEERIEEQASGLLDAAVGKRLEAGQNVVLLAETPGALERERFVRPAAALRRPRHLIFIEAPRDAIAEDDRPGLNELRVALDAGRLGEEGFHTGLRLGGSATSEVKRIVFRPPPEDD